jgi:molybdate transport system ATP-binding protein
MSELEFRARLTYPSGFRIDAAFTTDARITALFGPSGSGKTSILSMIAGLRRPDEGLVRLGSRVLFDSAAAIAVPPDARRMGYAFQQHLLFPHLTVRQNLLYGSQRCPRDARVVAFDELVGMLELSELVDRLPHTLSGGQRQRVALGRALLCGPELLLLDEPLASIEEELRDRLLDYIGAATGALEIPVLYVAHSRYEVRRIAHRVIEVRDGKVTNVTRGGS